MGAGGARWFRPGRPRQQGRRRRCRTGRRTGRRRLGL